MMAPTAPGMMPPTAPGMMPPTAPGMMPPTTPGAAPGSPPSASGINYVDVDCPLEALPKMGNIVGKVVDAESQAGISGATVVAIDVDRKEYRASTDGSGAFRIDGVKPGSVTLKADADKYLSHSESVDIKPREDSKPQIGMSAKPKQANVVIVNKEIVIKKQIHFETDSAVIKGDSSSLMEEIADVIQHNANIKRIEVQGHTDNTGTPDHNMQLSQARAESVKAWLTSHGVEGSRLEAKGYGATRPRVPNVTAANRAQNRRVQFVILEKAP
jgi:outer membrane protein OmpA-like peptidoglycan-associated protein